MSNKTAKKRSTKSAIKALRRKRHNKNRANYENGGRVGKFYGGPLRTDIDVNPEDYKDYTPPPQEEDKIVESQPLPEPDPTTGPDPESGGVNDIYIKESAPKTSGGNANIYIPDPSATSGGANDVNHPAPPKVAGGVNDIYLQDNTPV